MVVAALDAATGDLQWNTFIGSPGVERSDGSYQGEQIAAEGGEVYASTGTDTSWGTPLNPLSGVGDLVVAKLDANGQLLWHTYSGSASFIDRGIGLAVDTNRVCVAGDSGASWLGPGGESPINAFVESPSGREVDASVLCLRR